MDLIDKKILCELDLNCRTPISQIAKRLRINRNVAAYRIKNLEEKGVIKNYICQVSLGKLGYRSYKIHFKLRNLKDEEARFVDEVIACPSVISFLKTEGSFDYSAVLAVKTIVELDAFISRVKSRFRNLVKDYMVSIIVYSRIFKLHKLLLNQPGVKMERFAGESVDASIDNSDKKILKQISQQGNLPIIEISRKTRLSLDIVRHRLKKLQDSVVTAFRPIINVDKLGYFHYVVMLQTRTATRAQEQKLITWCSVKRNVLYCTKRIGNFDFEVNVAITDIDELNSFLADIKTEFGDVIDSLDTVLNSRIVKLDYVPF